METKYKKLDRVEYLNFSDRVCSGRIVGVYFSWLLFRTKYKIQEDDSSFSTSVPEKNIIQKL